MVYLSNIRFRELPVFCLGTLAEESSTYAALASSRLHTPHHIAFQHGVTFYKDRHRRSTTQPPLTWGIDQPEASESNMNLSSMKPDRFDAHSQHRAWNEFPPRL